MSRTPSARTTAGDTPMTRSYVLVIVVEVIVLVALWLFQEHFTH